MKLFSRYRIITINREFCPQVLLWHGWSGIASKGIPLDTWNQDDFIIRYCTVDSIEKAELVIKM